MHSFTRLPPGQPTVVLDWGWIRALSRPKLPTGYSYLVPEVALFEPATSSRPAAFMEKMRAFSVETCRNLYIAQHWNHLADFETGPGILVDRHSIAHARVSDLIAQRGSPRRGEWACRTAGNPDAITDYTSRKASFDQIREEFATRALQTAQHSGFDPRAVSWDDIYASIRTPEAPLPLLIHEMPKYDTPSWREALGVFPDRHVVGRYARLLLWYICKALKIRSTKRLKNDWEDFHYALLASFADQFWTRDSELARTVREVFPRTHVVYVPT
jgi:hypothetical protein